MLNQLNSTQLNSTQLNSTQLKHNYCKLFALLITICLLAIGCGGDGYVTASVTSTFRASIDYYSSGTSTNITILSQNSSSSVNSSGSIGFSVSGAGVGENNYTVAIENVVNSSGTSLELSASDFSYSKTTKVLTLSASGLTKFEAAASSLTALKDYQYVITFKFTTTSDMVDNKETTVEVGINLRKAYVITKTDIENMMKRIKYSDFDPIYTANAGEIVIASGSGSGLGKNTFSFASATYSTTSPNFSLTATPTLAGNFTYTASQKAYGIASAIFSASGYFSGYYSVGYSTPTISADKKSATFTFNIGNLKSGYVLSSDVSSTLTIKLTLADDNSGRYTANWN